MGKRGLKVGVRCKLCKRDCLMLDRRRSCGCWQQVCVCCVCKREREREMEGGRGECSCVSMRQQFFIPLTSTDANSCVRSCDAEFASLTSSRRSAVEPRFLPIVKRYSQTNL